MYIGFQRVLKLLQEIDQASIMLKYLHQMIGTSELKQSFKGGIFMQWYNMTLASLLVIGTVIVLIVTPFLGYSSGITTTVFVVGILFILLNVGIYLYLRTKKIRE